jgi:hypothetical protein
MDTSIIISIIAMDTTVQCLRAESMRWNTMKHFAEVPCMILMAMKRPGTGNSPV